MNRVYFYIILFALLFILTAISSFEHSIANWTIKKKRSAAFVKGDLVKAFGNDGVVKKISDNGMFVEVAFEEAPCTVIFTIEGKVHKWNARPSLEKR